MSSYLEADVARVLPSFVFTLNIFQARAHPRRRASRKYNEEVHLELGLTSEAEYIAKHCLHSHVIHPAYYLAENLWVENLNVLENESDHTWRAGDILRYWAGQFNRTHSEIAKEIRRAPG